MTFATLRRYSTVGYFIGFFTGREVIGISLISYKFSVDDALDKMAIGSIRSHANGIVLCPFGFEVVAGHDVWSHHAPSFADVELG